MSALLLRLPYYSYCSKFQNVRQGGFTPQLYKVMCERFAVESTVLENSQHSSTKNATFGFGGGGIHFFFRSTYLRTTWPTTSIAKGNCVPYMPLGHRGIVPLKESRPWKISDVLPACRGGSGRRATSFKHSSGNMQSRPNICHLTFRSVSAHTFPSKVKG
jgi:hypothetical protein